MEKTEMVGGNAVTTPNSPSIDLESGNDSKTIMKSFQRGASLMSCNSLRNESQFTFEFKDVKVWVDIPKWMPGFMTPGTPGSRVDILRGVSGKVDSGQILAVVGASGSGKTTLLDRLVDNPMMLGGSQSGEILLNGQSMTKDFFRRKCAFVAQHDELWGALTVRENLELASQLYCAQRPEATRNQMIDEVLDGFGLRVCEHNKVGNPIIKGISGGQKRRLSLGVALLKRPSILFLDEPTSGLDSKSASEIMKIIGEVASSLNVMVICVIHQPSSRLFLSFDRVAVLCRGKIAYFGLANESVDYFESLGEKMPQNYNPCDFLLDVTNPDFIGEEKMNYIIEAWSKREKESDNVDQQIENAMMGTTEFSGPVYQASFCKQITVLIKRALLIYVRDPGAFLGRCFFYLQLSFFFGILYFDTARTQEKLFDLAWVICWGLMAPSYMCMVAIPLNTMSEQIVKQEAKNGMYHPSAYTVAISVASIPFIFGVIVLYCLPIYFLPTVNSDSMRYLPFTLVIFLFAGVFEAFGVLMGALIPNFLIALCGYIGTISVFFVLNGFFKETSSVTWLFRWIIYMSPHHYAWKALSYLVYEGDTYDDYAQCTATPGKVCYGATGDHVLDNLAGTSPDVKVWECCVILLVMAFLLRVFHALLVRKY